MILTISNTIYNIGDKQGDWSTIANMARLLNHKNVNIIQNWISRGIIPKENVIEVTELNNVKLVKVERYQSRRYNRTVKQMH